MHIAITIWSILASWQWGDWKNLYQYHTTMLYMSLMNVFYLLLTSKHALWRMQPEFGLPFIIVVSLYTFIIFPCTVLLFLSNYPKIFKKQVLHILKWITIYISVEWIGSLFNRIEYEHEWHLGWSFLFLIVMFPMLRLHYKKPILAYIISIFVIVFLMYFFDVPWKTRL